MSAEREAPDFARDLPKGSVVPSQFNSVRWLFAQLHDVTVRDDGHGSGTDDDCPDWEAGSSSEDDDDESMPAPTRATRSKTGPLDYVQTFSAFDAGLKNGTVILQTLAKDSPKDPQDKEYIPRSFNNIKSIDDVEQRNTWYRTYYAEIDGLLENPDVLAMVPKPDSISESELHYIHTIFSRKNDGRKKTRSVLASGKDKLEAMGSKADPADKKTVAEAEKAIEGQIKKLAGLQKSKGCK